ncbi:uncharacterized protein ACDP82_001223 [Pangshura tecta]
MPEDFVGGEHVEEEEDKLTESTQHTVLPNSQDLFLSLTEVASQPSQGSIPDHEAMEGTSAANFSSLLPLSQRLFQIRQWKESTHDEMFYEIMQSTRNERAHLNEWKDTVSQYRKAASECEDRTDEREDRRDNRDERWWQEDQRRQDATLQLLRDQMDTFRRLVELQNGSRITEWHCSPCLTTIIFPAPAQVPYPPHPDAQKRREGGSMHPGTPPCAQPKQQKADIQQVLKWPFPPLLGYLVSSLPIFIIN